MKRLLFGTTNPTRLQHLRALLKPLPLELVSLADLGLALRVVEDGTTPTENALIKANAYFAATQLPTLAVDVGLTIAALPTAQQPGVFVRRLQRTDEEANDTELLAHYRAVLAAVGGQSDGEWSMAVALRLTPDRLAHETFTIPTRFTAIPSSVMLPGEPLSSLQIEPQSGKYYAELTPDERFAVQKVRAQQIFAFVQSLIPEI
ncbi:MAG: hypothetical protein KF832_01005 [Caldilineaceae bacterium]|nr:hypothetical protein [Caldilineaceae bacterium]